MRISNSLILLIGIVGISQATASASRPFLSEKFTLFGHSGRNYGKILYHNCAPSNTHYSIAAGFKKPINE
ncbi:MAG: hypothetical protein LBE97_00830 [Holosporales bacterium]|jgi:hypothetical protein|nr:hypothetical protein [Holosporales bacterium]